MTVRKTSPSATQLLFTGVPRPVRMIPRLVDGSYWPYSLATKNNKAIGCCSASDCNSPGMLLTRCHDDYLIIKIYSADQWTRARLLAQRHIAPSGVIRNGGYRRFSDVERWELEASALPADWKSIQLRATLKDLHHRHGH